MAFREWKLAGGQQRRVIISLTDVAAVQETECDGTCGLFVHLRCGIGFEIDETFEGFKKAYLDGLDLDEKTEIEAMERFLQQRRAKT